jgi:RNA polymerase sigma-70 factor (ECF subfamily)
VRAALARLPEQLQTVVRLRIHDNLTFAEIAARLEIPLGTALTRMRTALAKLKAVLTDHEP